MKLNVPALIIIASLLVGCSPQKTTEPSPVPSTTPTKSEARTSVVIAEKDFTQDLPDTLQKAKTETTSTTITVGENLDIELEIQLESISDSPDGGQYFRKLTVLNPSEPEPYRLSATIGNPVNLGSATKIMMNVPILVTWAFDDSSGHKSRTRQFEIFADGSAKEQTEENQAELNQES